MIRVALSGTRPHEPHWARIAGEDIAIDQPISQLAPFTIPNQGAADVAAPFALEQPEQAGKPIRAWVANEWREVWCAGVGGEGYFVDIEGIGGFAIRADGGAITYQGDGKHQVEARLIGEAALGPALTLALALRGTFCWHASGVIDYGRVTALMGDSGAGKSTLAVTLAKRGYEWMRIADDVLPIRIGADGVMALPHFPQLKLSSDQQVGRDVAENVLVRAVTVIEAGRDDQKAKIETLTAREAVSVLVKHTLATSLFDAGMLAAHMEVCTAAASRVDVKRLIYPHTLNSLPEALELLSG